MNEWEAVQARISCRSYQNVPLSDETLHALRTCLGEITAETGLHMQLVHTPDSTLKLAGAMFSGAVHTYAVLSGADDDRTAACGVHGSWQWDDNGLFTVEHT